MSENINTPYPLSNIDKKIIRNNFMTHADWEKNIFDDLKEKIRTHLRNEQNNKCCYCKNELGFDIKQVDIEHIIPKSKFEKFTFNPKNLALSCPACNTIKSTNCVLKNDLITNYPRSKKNFKIIHPHYDIYSTHIKIKDECLYIAKSKKGSETITMCELFRLQVVEDNAKKFNTKRSLIAQLVENIRNSDTSEVKELFELLKGTIE